MGWLLGLFLATACIAANTQTPIDSPTKTVEEGTVVCQEKGSGFPCVSGRVEWFSFFGQIETKKKQNKEKVYSLHTALLVTAKSRWLPVGFAWKEVCALISKKRG